MSKKMLEQLTIEGEAERKIRLVWAECKHDFGPATPSFDYSSDRVYFCAKCRKCGLITD